MAVEHSTPFQACRSPHDHAHSRQRWLSQVQQLDCAVPGKEGACRVLYQKGCALNWNNCAKTMIGKSVALHTALWGDLTVTPAPLLTVLGRLWLFWQARGTNSSPACRSLGSPTSCASTTSRRCC